MSAGISTVPLHHDIQGDKGPWVTLVHGGLVASYTWHRQVLDHSFNLANFGRVLVPDLRGYGESPQAPEGGEYDIPSMAADIRALWDTLGIEATALVGFSLGGFVAQQLALDNPDRVTALVLVSTAERLSTEAAEAFRVRADAIEAQGLSVELEEHLARAFSTGFQEDQPELFEQYAHQAAKNRADAVARTFRRLGDFPPESTDGRIDSPTLILCGGEDPALGASAARQLHERIAGSEMLVVPGAGHTVHLENPHVFNHQVVDFLSRQEIRK